MNQKTKLILAGAILIVVGVVAYFLLSLSSANNKLAKYVPKETLVSFQINLMEMGKKIKFDELAEMKFFKKEIIRAMNSSGRDMAESIMKDPSKSGIDIRQSPFLFVYNNSKSDFEPVFCLLMGVSDAEKFKSFIKNLDDDFEIKSSDKLNVVSIENSEEVKLIYDDKLAYLIVDLANKDISHKKIFDKLSSQAEENSILALEQYAANKNETDDMMMFVNKKSIQAFAKDVLEKNGSTLSDNQFVDEYIAENMPYLMRLNFDQNEIKLTVVSEKNTNEKYFQQKGVTEADLTELSPDGNPLAYMISCLNTSSIYSILKKIPNADREFEQVNEMLSKYDVDLEGIFKMFDGKVTASLLPDLKDVSNEIFQKREPVFLFSVGIADKQLANKIFDDIILNQGLENRNGIYVKTEFFDTDQIAYSCLLTDNKFYISNDVNALSKKMNGNSWKSLDEKLGKSLAMNNPFCLFANMDYDTYKPIFSKLWNESEVKIIQDLKPVLSNFMHFSATQNATETNVALKLSDSKENSLWRIFLMIEDTYKTF